MNLSTEKEKKENDVNSDNYPNSENINNIFYEDNFYCIGQENENNNTYIDNKVLNIENMSTRNNTTENDFSEALEKFLKIQLLVILLYPMIIL